VSLADRDYWREVPEYRRLMGRDSSPEPLDTPREIGRDHDPHRTGSDFWRQPISPGRAVIITVGAFAFLLLSHLNILGEHWHFFVLP
jgi:hypothetical protein